MPPSNLNPTNYAKLTAALVTLVVTAAGSAAAQPLVVDPPPAACPVSTSIVDMPDPQSRAGSPILVQTGEVRMGRPVIQFNGNVVLQRADQKLSTEALSYNPASGQLILPGAMEYQDSSISFKAASASYNLASETGQFNKLEYLIAGALGRGSAMTASLLGRDQTQLRQVDFTTCPEGNDDWQIEAQQITLDQRTGRGTAKKAKLVFKGVPVLYAPSFSFPIDARRQSGFLYPSLGSASGNGLDISVPWYWNIAPQMDATAMPRLITGRGLMFAGQFRWLTARSFGQIDAEYLPDDNDTNTERHYYSVEHRFRLNQAWRTDVRASRVSDDRYFIDFGQSLAQTSRQFLRSAAILQGKGNYWNFSLSADDFQVIDPSVGDNREPYRRLPRMSYGLDLPLAGSRFDLRLDSELVYFDRDIGVTGTRLDVYPRLRWNFERGGGFFTPSLGYRLTSYDIDRLDGFTDGSPARGTMIGSLDGGLFFDRKLASGNLQTLEPRLFYLYVPFENQDDLPGFDTAELTYGFSQLFHYNRFAGADRQGDANQLTLALSSRIMDATTGLERFTINAGQLFYFSDRKVQLQPASLADTETSDDFVLEMTYRPGKAIVASVGLQWDWDNDQVNVGWAGIEYSGKNALQIALDYRFRRTRLEQVDFRARWPVGRDLNLVTRWNYALDGKDTLEALAGLEYSTCCWALRVMARHYLSDRNGDSRNALVIELELKGLGSVGRKPYALFQPEAFR